MNNICFSVIMPVFNKEKYVHNSINSVLNQTYKNFELILVDDGSTDRSAEIINNIKDDRIIYIKQKNGGESIARNNGIHLAKNKYIAFLDSDDLWLPDFLEKMVELINNFPEVKVFGCAYLHEEVGENTMKKAIQMNKEDKDIFIDNYFYFVLTNQQSLTASTAVIEKSVFNRAGYFPEGLKNWVDLDLWARIGLYYDIVFTKKICAIYNDVPDSVSKVKTKLHAPIFDEYKNFIKESKISGEKKKYFWEYVAKSKMYSAYQQYLLDGRKLKAIKEILPFFMTKHNRLSYWSMMIQFIITPERFLKLNSLRRKIIND